MVTPTEAWGGQCCPQVEPQEKLSFASGKRSAITSQVVEALQNCPGGSFLGSSARAPPDARCPRARSLKASFMSRPRQFL